MSQTLRGVIPNLQADVRFHEYTAAADPRMPSIPIASLAASLHQEGATRVVPFDLSQTLGCEGPATTPNLLAAFLRIKAGESLATRAAATSQLFYVIRGGGRSESPLGTIEWSRGDLFTLPCVPGALDITHTADADTAIYWVHDEPLLRYLGVTPSVARFRPTLFTSARLMEELDKVRNQPGALERNRTGILLGNAANPLTLTITHTLWSLLNVLPAGVVQKPHRHNSVALDLCIDAGPDTYTAIGPKLGADGMVEKPTLAYWRPGAAFVTPPGWWHSHHNHSKQDAFVLPIQDAGLQTYMRTLDIRFSSGPKAAAEQ